METEAEALELWGANYRLTLDALDHLIWLGASILLPLIRGHSFGVSRPLPRGVSRGSGLVCAHVRADFLVAGHRFSPFFTPFRMQKPRSEAFFYFYYRGKVSADPGSKRFEPYRKSPYPPYPCHHGTRSNHSYALRNGYRISSNVFMHPFFWCHLSCSE